MKNSNMHNHILIVEDSPTQAVQLKNILNKHKYQVSLAENGEKAYRMAIQSPPDLIISDIVMPVMNGYDLCKKIKNNEEIGQIPVILLTSLSDPEDVIKGLECGADNFFTKPFNETSLLPHIEQILTNQELCSNKNINEFKIVVGGRKHIISPNQKQMLTLLISTYETAIQKNNELLKARDELNKINVHLEELVEERTAELLKEISQRVKIQEELQKANSEKDKLFSIIAHDLRAPFNGFIGLTELMLEEATTLSPSELMGIAKRLNNSANNLYQLLENLLEWVQIQKQSIKFSPEELNLSDLVEQNIAAINERAIQKGIHIFNAINEKQKVFGDEKMIHTVLRNLLSNAVKFTNEGGSIWIKSQKTENHEIEISVIDSGVGITKNVQKKLFKIDENIGNRGTDGELSTGLGLILCKEFIEMHKGKIQVKSEPGNGSNFSFTLKESHPDPF